MESEKIKKLKKNQISRITVDVSELKKSKEHYNPMRRSGKEDEKSGGKKISIKVKIK